MAFDGIVVANIKKELKDTLEGGRISKIAQPEKDALLITVNKDHENYRLFISANASLPLIYLTDNNRQSPLTAPNFCMVLRKYIGSGRITHISQPGLERVIEIEIEHLNDMGDLCRKKLIIELMGKYSNIIFCDDEGTIIDSIKHVSSQMSSVREVLPGRPYFLPQTVSKADPLTVTEDEFTERIRNSNAPLTKALYQNLTGISPIVAEEIAHISSLDGEKPACELNPSERIHLYHMLTDIMDDVRSASFFPNIIYHMDEPVEFASIRLTCLEGDGYSCRSFDSISRLLETYYSSKDAITRIRQRSSDLRRVVQTALERNYKKYDLQLKELKDTEKRDQYRIYGELINTYGYELKGGEDSLTCFNYYTNEDIRIPLDGQLTASENAQKYFDRYNKLKRTNEALNGLIEQTLSEIEHLESISTAIDISLKEEDLTEIREELIEYGYIKKRPAGSKKPKITSRPFHYISSDGFDIYVGKNNYQNEEVTFKIASGNDWWFHAKGIPGSHVIVKTDGKELPDRVYEEAGSLAAYYSKGRNNAKVEVDYVQRKEIKKVSGAAPGFVIYHTNYSLMAEPKLELTEVR